MICFFFFFLLWFGQSMNTSDVHVFEGRCACTQNSLRVFVVWFLCDYWFFFSSTFSYEFIGFDEFICNIFFVFFFSLLIFYLLVIDNKYRVIYLLFFSFVIRISYLMLRHLVLFELFRAIKQQFRTNEILILGEKEQLEMGLYGKHAVEG